jgi:TonB-dependent receptor
MHLSSGLLGGMRSSGLGFVTAVLITLAVALTGRAQPAPEPRGTLEGTVYNRASGLPLSRAKVVVAETSQEVLTDDGGRFSFRAAPARTLRLEVSYLGFVAQTETVSVPPNGVVVRDIRLAREGAAKATAEGETVVLEKFEVIADQTMSAQALAMNEQRHAANIKNVVAFDELGDRGFENIGNYVRYLPGVVIIEDGENPGKIALGGFPAEMSSLQLDGADLAGTGIGPESSRTMALQEIPMMNIERVEVSKVPTPDMPAAGLGGSLNLVTKTNLGLKRPSLSYQAYMNFNNRDGLTFGGGQRQPTAQLSPRHAEPSVNASVAFPVGKNLAISLGASRSWKQRPTDDTPSEVAFWNLKATYPTGLPKDFAYAIGQWKQEADITRTENYQANVDWKIAQQDTLSVGIQRRVTNSVKATSFFTARININYDAIGNATSSQSRGNTGRIEMGSNNPLNYESRTINDQANVHYRHRGNDWRIDAQGSYSSSSRVRSSFGKGYFAGTLGNILNLNMRADGLNQGDSILPRTYTLQDAAGKTINPYDGNNYALLNTTEEYAVYKTDLASGKLDVARAFGGRFSLKTGLSYNRMDKDDIRPNRAYTFSGQNRITSVSAYDLIDESIGVKMNGNPVRWISPVKAYRLFVDHPEWFSLNSSAVQNAVTNSKRVVEDISAAYVRFDLKMFQNRANLTGGLRYEKTELGGWSMLKDSFGIYQRDARGNLISDGRGGFLRKTTDATELIKLQFIERGTHESRDYDGLYPSANFNYAFSDNLVARAAYARTLGRPDVRYVVAGITLPVPTDTNPTSARTIVVGNPGLKPWTADSFHLSLDSYHLKGGFGSIGVYRKDVKNFFAQRGNQATKTLLESYNIADSDIEYMLADNYVLKRWENVGAARLAGVEASYRQDLWFVPSWLKVTQVWVNYTHLQVSGENEEDFVGFTPDILSFGINYIRSRFSVRLTGAYQAETRKSYILVVPGTSVEGFIPPRTYEYQAAATQYGVSAEYAFTKRLSLYLNWNNVFSEDLRVYRRAPDTPKHAQNAQRYVMPSYIMLGVRGRF